MSSRVEGRPAPVDGRLAHVPALDGVRGVAVAAVLLYHGGFSWARGGFLGVSTFFTLSGFLITRLLLVDAASHGRVSLRRFYERRARRLLPASLLTLVLVLVYAAVVATPTERQDLGGDVLATLAQVVNWRFILEDRTYAELFTTPSLLQHAWSLAIEEQFYLLFPPLVTLAVRRRWGLRTMTRGVGVLLAASAVVTAALLATGASLDRLYFGTDTRAPELLLGVLLALVLARRPIRAADRVAVAAAGGIGLVVTVVAWGTVAQSATWLYRGGLWLYALMSCALVAGCLVPGPVRRVLEVAPLRILGQISYGVYLLHWPIFRWLSAERLGTSRTGAFLVAVPATLAAASLSHVLLEDPIRRGRARARAAGRPGRWRPSHLTAAGALTALVVVAGAVALPDGGPEIDIEGAVDRYDELAFDVPARPGAPRLSVFGDSTATSTSIGLALWANRTGRIDLAPAGTQLGCGILIEGEVRYNEEPGRLDERCATRPSHVAAAAPDSDLVLVQFGPWDVADHRLPGSEEWVGPGDAVYEQAVFDHALSLVDALGAHGAVVLWVQPPLIAKGTVDGVAPAEPEPVSDPERMAWFRTVGEDLMAARPDRVRLIDLAGWMAGLDGGELDAEMRPDGVHFTEEAALFVAEAFLAPQILAAWEEIDGAGG